MRRKLTILLAKKAKHHHLRKKLIFVVAIIVILLILTPHLTQVAKRLTGDITQAPQPPNGMPVNLLKGVSFDTADPEYIVEESPPITDISDFFPAFDTVGPSIHGKWLYDNGIGSYTAGDFTETGEPYLIENQKAGVMPKIPYQSGPAKRLVQYMPLDRLVPASYNFSDQGFKAMGLVKSMTERCQIRFEEVTRFGTGTQFNHTTRTPKLTADTTWQIFNLYTYGGQTTEKLRVIVESLDDARCYFSNIWVIPDNSLYTTPVYNYLSSLQSWLNANDLPIPPETLGPPPTAVGQNVNPGTPPTITNRLVNGEFENAFFQAATYTQGSYGIPIGNSSVNELSGMVGKWFYDRFFTLPSNDMTYFQWPDEQDQSKSVGLVTRRRNERANTLTQYYKLDRTVGIDEQLTPFSLIGKMRSVEGICTVAAGGVKLNSSWQWSDSLPKTFQAAGNYWKPFRLDIPSNANSTFMEVHISSSLPNESYGNPCLVDSLALIPTAQVTPYQTYIQAMTGFQNHPNNRTELTVQEVAAPIVYPPPTVSAEIIVNQQDEGAFIEYTCMDREEDPTTILVEYSDDGGGTFQNATIRDTNRTSLSNPMQQVTCTSGTGTKGDLIWLYEDDLSPTALLREKAVQLRLTVTSPPPLPSTPTMVSINIGNPIQVDQYQFSPTDGGKDAATLPRDIDVNITLNTPGNATASLSGHLPVGLSFDAGTNTISGIPTELGKCNTRVTWSGGSGILTLQTRPTAGNNNFRDLNGDGMESLSDILLLIGDLKRIEISTGVIMGCQEL